MKAVIYARYSSDNQREESIDGQLRECKEYAERNGITVLGSYIDRALSAKTDNRPDFQRMIKDSAKGLFDIVLVWKLDRFSRSRLDSALYKAFLRKNGVKVVSAKEHISDGPEGIILESMLEGYAEFYSAELSVKIHRGQKENALKGLNNGGSVPLGYVLNKQTQKLEIDPVTAPVVVEIFTRYAAGETIREIVDSLNERGLKTSQNKPFRMNSFDCILKNRKYIGEYRYQDVVIPGGVPAIVSQELFDRVQAKKKRNKHAPAASKADVNYLLSTKLFCGKCGTMMVGESGTGRNGAKHYYYKCGSAKRKTGCTKKAVKKEWIENLVLAKTLVLLSDDKLLERLSAQLFELQQKENTDIPILKRQLDETKRGIENILNAIQQGILTPSTKERLEQLEETKAQLEISLTQAELEKPLLSKKQILFWLHRFRGIDRNDPQQCQRLIDSFVNSVYVFDDKLLLTFNYHDGTETISLQDIDGSDLGGDAPPKDTVACATVSFLHRGLAPLTQGPQRKLWAFFCTARPYQPLSLDNRKPSQYNENKGFPQQKGGIQMKKARNATWFILGVLVTVMVSQLALPAVATLAGKTIDVFTGVNIYVDDEKLNPTDANGNAVEVFVYNGTTYLPVRAVSDALDVPVQWDGKTSSVYLGKHSSEKMAVLLANLDYFTGKSLSLKNLKDNLGNEHPQSLNTNFNNTYLLNGQYSAISGTLFQVYEYRSKYIETTLNIYGDGELLYTATVTQGVQPIDFKVDLTGVLELRVELAGNSVMYDAGALADLGLWT